MAAVAGPAWLVWLETSAVAVAMRRWLWLYPAVEVAHIVGFVVLVGGAAMFDLRLLGVGRGIRITDLARHLLLPARAALGLVIPTGLLMFTAHATEMAENPAFRLKLTLIAAAALNAAVFHQRTLRTVGTWDLGVTAPLAARLAGAASLALWAGVILCGRLLAYL
jgi:hypothetical protein